MKKAPSNPQCLLALGILLSAFAPSCWAADQPPLDTHLEPLRPLLDKTWKGPFVNSTPEHPIVDTARWERALNGRAVRILHSINDGFYGGESLVMWDGQKQQLVYFYFTTAGFMTSGTMRFEGSTTITHETVTGSSEGITEVRATSERTSNGGLHVKSEYLKNGSWVPGHEVTYHEDASAKVLFR